MDNGDLFADPDAFVHKNEDFRETLKKWQDTLTTLARIYSAPAAFIVQRTKQGYLVASASDQPENPYPVGTVVPAGTNIFCKHVCDEQRTLYVQDASLDRFWDTNPEVSEDGFRSYLGMPLRWPDGPAFGTICVMDFRATAYDDLYQCLLRQFQSLIETDLKLMAQHHALQDEKHEVERANLTKSAFVANMSHELRTPLNAVMGFSDLMRHQIAGPLSKNYVDYAEDIHTSAAHLLALVNDVLDLSKIEAGKMELKEEAFLLEDELSRVVQMMSERASTRRITIALISPESPVTILADMRALRQICLNLLSNALDFSPDASRIELRSARTSDGGCHVSVVDQGCGIASEELDYVFEPFKSADSDLSGNADLNAKRLVKGIGLGLSISKRLCDLHNAKIGVESVLGEGTTITVAFPPERLLETGR